MAIEHNAIWWFESGRIVQNSYLKHRMDPISIYVKWTKGYAPSSYTKIIDDLIGDRTLVSALYLTACLSQLQTSDATELVPDIQNTVVSLHAITASNNDSPTSMNLIFWSPLSA